MNEMLSRAAARTVNVVRGIREDQYGLPTPCAEYDVRTLLGHLSWVALMFEALADKEPMPPEDNEPGALESRVEGMVAGWSKQEAFEGESPGMGLPMTVVFQMGLGDLVFHGWDLARATGQDYEVDKETGEAMFVYAEQMAPMARQNGVFGDEVAVPQDAPPFERALGLTGRDPGWKP
ncbi:TIGR03086 family metal-binding protein [Planobispora takensis]|uniref:TIGR03086 family protein n=1 Tax=Planobispora takensis TaxID=1367882 RepID=A0A8J3WUY8_9ACTN|nr:TIGR03086 family metal-binding protein [Planobispora takensis]GII00382.1 TIGR03086 family protein [Planobispora takensis]